MNRQLWDSFLQQIDAQVDGDFVALATEYESVTGHPFKVDEERHVLYSMLDQAMMTQDASLLKHAVGFIARLPHSVQNEFRAFERRGRMNAMTSSHLRSEQQRSVAYR
jgi:hypothetical protein